MNKVLLAIAGLLLGLAPALGQGEARGTILTLTERGDHENGMRVGKWEYYDHPRYLSLKIDYSQGKLIYVRPDTSLFTVKSGSSWVKKRLVIPTRFHGSLTTLIDHYDNFVVPEALFQQKKFFSAWLTFYVGPGGATNPEVHQDPGNGVKEQLLALFEGAPNSWIAGTDETGEVVTSLLAIRFDYCAACDNNTPAPGKVLFTTVNPRQPGPGGGRNPLFSFSPDNGKLIVTPISVGMETAEQNTIVIDTKTKQIHPLPYQPYTGHGWIDNDHILFLPKYYSRTGSVLAKLELSSSNVTFVSDSATSMHMMSPDHKKMAFTFPYKNTRAMAIHDFQTSSNKVFQEILRPTLEQWSPDGKYIVVSKVDESFLKYTVINTETGEARPLPVLGARVCGWSADGNFIYQLKSSREEYRGSREIERPTQWDGIVSVRTVSTTQYEPKSELLETDLSTNLPKTLYKKAKNIGANYSATKNKLLLVMDDDAYLLDAKVDAKPVKIIERCSIAQWSPDGEYIAYISTRDRQLHLYTVATGQSEFLTLPAPDSKRKK